MKQMTLFPEEPEEEHDGLHILFSTHYSKKYGGRAYWKTRSGVIFISSIYEDAKKESKEKNCRVSLSFVIRFLCIYFHEYLHLFLKFRLGKWSCSEKTVIEPLSQRLTEATIQNEIHLWINLFSELDSECVLGV